MKKLVPVALRAILFGLMLFGSPTSHARLVKWTLDDVRFSTYQASVQDPEHTPIAHPVVTGSLDLSGWFIVDTNLLRIVDWQIGGQFFAPASCGPIFVSNCADWVTQAAIGSSASLLPGAQSFEFIGFDCGHCDTRGLTLVALTSLTTEETGGKLQLASGALHYTTGFEDPYQYTVGGFLTSGSLTGTVVPEPTAALCFGLWLAAIAGVQRFGKAHAH
jgi:hypothetical protein